MSRQAPSDAPEKGGIELFTQVLEDIRTEAEDILRQKPALGGMPGRDPLAGLKSISKLLANRASTLPAEYSSLELCTKFDKDRRRSELDRYHETIRDIIMLALEAEMCVGRLDSAFNRGESDE